MKIYSKSDIGLVRENNQDYYKCGKLSDDAVYSVVCDGMGGVNGGEVASSLSASFVSENIRCYYTQDQSQLKDKMLELIKATNDEVCAVAMNDSRLTGMGTTIVLTVVVGDKVHVAYVGDSRAYLVTESSVRQITVDHSLVQKMINSGEITEEEAKHHPQKNIITRALGIDMNIEADYVTCDLKRGDFVLICTDGFSNYLSESQILQMVQKQSDREALVSEFIDAAKDCGGVDNITVVIVENK